MLVVALGLGLGVGCAGRYGAVAGSADYPTLEPDGPLDPYAEPATAAAAQPTTTGQVGDAIPVAFEIGDPRAIAAMVVELRVGDYALPSRPNHVVKRAGRGVQRVTVRAVPGAAVTADERKQALIADDFVDARNAAIRSAAGEAVGDARGDRARVTGLVEWVYTHVSYVLGDDVIASDVLARRTGDCSEMSLLFVAMARSVGIPARRVVGLAATYEAGAPAFGYHAWAEVAIDGRWVQVDPTWNEPLADATHIKLLEGYEDTWALAAAKIEEISVVNVTRTPDAPAFTSDPVQLARELPVHLRLGRSARLSSDAAERRPTRSRPGSRRRRP